MSVRKHLLLRMSLNLYAVPVKRSHICYYGDVASFMHRGAKRIPSARLGIDEPLCFLRGTAFFKRKTS